MANALAKPRQIDVMPEITGILPLLHDLSIQRKETSSRLHLNLANVRKADAIGLTILLSLIYLGKSDPENYDVKVSSSNNEKVNQLLKELDILNLIGELGSPNIPENGDLFQNTQNLLINKINNQTSNTDDYQKLVLFNPKKNKNRQEALDAFSRALKNFMAFDSPRTFNHEQIVKVFIELAKNTFDHSKGIGLAGLRFCKSHNEKKVQLVYCDTGEGICRSVRTYLANPQVWRNSSHIQHLKEKGSFMDLLHLAFQAGFSTKLGNKVNHGMGLTLITQGAAGCDFNVLLRDGESIIDLSGIQEPYTHAKLRTKSSRTTASKLLLFYFEKGMNNDSINH